MEYIYIFDLNIHSTTSSEILTDPALSITDFQTSLIGGESIASRIRHSEILSLVVTTHDWNRKRRNIYIANISLQMNDTMRTLTIFASILLPLTLVASIYGMNGLDLNKLTELPTEFYNCLNHNDNNNECVVLSIQQKEMGKDSRKQSYA